MRNKGITLVALIITIIVLLILSGVTISLVIGQNGILNHAKMAKEEQIKAEIKEEIGMSILDINADLLKKTSSEELNKEAIKSNCTKLLPQWSFKLK